MRIVQTAEGEPKYVTLRNAAHSSGVDLRLLKSMVNSSFIRTGVQEEDNAVMVDFRLIFVLEKAGKMLSNEAPVLEENVLKALGDMMLRMTGNIDYELENLKRGHQLVSEDDIKKNIARYKGDQEFFLEAIEWCNSHRPQIIG